MALQLLFCQMLLPDLFKTTFLFSSCLAFSPYVLLESKWCNYTVILTWLQLGSIPVLILSEGFDFYLLFAKVDFCLFNVKSALLGALLSQTCSPRARSLSAIQLIRYYSFIFFIELNTHCNWWKLRPPLISLLTCCASSGHIVPL